MEEGRADSDGKGEVFPETVLEASKFPKEDTEVLNCLQKNFASFEDTELEVVL